MSDAYPWKAWLRNVPAAAALLPREDRERLRNATAVQLQTAMQETVSQPLTVYPKENLKNHLTVRYLAHLHHARKQQGETLFTPAFLTERAYETIACEPMRLRKHATLSVVLSLFAPQDEPMFNGQYLLHHTCRTKDTQAVKILLRWGAPVDARDRDDETPLAAAIHDWLAAKSFFPFEGPKEKICLLLFEHGADMNPVIVYPTRQKPTTLLNEVLLESHLKTRQCMAKFLLGCHIPLHRAGTVSPAHYLRDEDFTFSVAPINSLETNGGRSILDAVPLEDRNEKGETALLGAARRGEVTLMERLVQKGADIHAVDDEGNGLAHRIATLFVPDFTAEKKAEWLSRLAQDGLKMDLPNKAGLSPLLKAAKYPTRSTLLNRLVELEEVDLNRQVPETGDTALHLLLSSEAVLSQWVSVLERDTLSTMFEEGGADLLLKNREGKSCLDLAWSILAAAASSRGACQAARHVVNRPDRCRKYHLGAAEFLPSDLLLQDARGNTHPTRMARDLAGAGILQEAFAPEKWDGREREALATIASLLSALPAFQRTRYELLIDQSVFSHVIAPEFELPRMTPPSRGDLGQSGRR